MTRDEQEHEAFAAWQCELIDQVNQLATLLEFAGEACNPLVREYDEARLALAVEALEELLVRGAHRSFTPPTG